MHHLLRADPSLHLLTPPFLVYLAQYPSDYRLPSTLFSGTGTSPVSAPVAAQVSDSGSNGDAGGVRKAPDFLSVARTEGEITVLYSVSLGAETKAGGKESDEELEVRRRKTLGVLGLDEPRESDGPYAAIRVQGPLNLSLTGILAALADALKRAQVPIFAISTWNTDYILVRRQLLPQATEALRSNGWHFAQS